MLGGAFEEGELRVKSGLKQEKLSVRPFKLRSSFYTSRGGGIGGPNSPYGALGSPGELSRNLFNEFYLQSSCMFFTITFAWFVRAVIRKTDFKAGLKIQRLNRN